MQAKIGNCLMNRQDKDRDPDRQVILYLALMLPIVLSACGGLYLIAAVFRSTTVGRPPTVATNVAPGQWVWLGTLSGIIAAISGLLSGVISSWMYERVGRAPPRIKSVILVATVLTFILLIVGGLLISLAQSGA